jgi:PDZ domain-containing secreted protein
MTRWCPLYGADTLDESWKVFDEEMRQERLEWYNDWKKKDDEDYARRQKIEELVKETERKKEVEAKRKKEEEAKEREEKRRKQFDDSKTWLTKANMKWKLWKY